MATVRGNTNPCNGPTLLLVKMRSVHSVSVSIFCCVVGRGEITGLLLLLPKACAEEGRLRFVATVLVVVGREVFLPVGGAPASAIAVAAFQVDDAAAAAAVGGCCCCLSSSSSSSTITRLDDIFVRDHKMMQRRSSARLAALAASTKRDCVTALSSSSDEEVEEPKKRVKAAPQSMMEKERSYWAKGCKFVVGVDEAGRGPLAG